MTNVQVEMPHGSQQDVTAISENRKPPTENSHCDLFYTVAAGDLHEMIPVRMLNEFTYRPRLGYREWVGGEWASDLETIKALPCRMFAFLESSGSVERKRCASAFW